MAYIEWFITHPIQAFALLFLQFAVLMVTRPKWEPTVLKWPLLIWFIWQDWLMNLLLSVPFVDPPAKRNEVVTKRMQRYVDDIKLDRESPLLDSWRYHFAVTLGKGLNYFDPQHIKRI